MRCVNADHTAPPMAFKPVKIDFNIELIVLRIETEAAKASANKTEPAPLRPLLI